MGSHITTSLLGLIAQLLLSLSLPAAGVARAWIRYRRAVAAEEWRTRRLAMALRATGPAARADIITAYARVEAAARPDPPARRRRLQRS